MEHAELTGADRLASMEAELAALTARECAAQRAARTGPVPPSAADGAMEVDTLSVCRFLTRRNLTCGPSFVDGRQGRSVPVAIRRQGRCLRTSLGKQAKREVRMEPRRPRWLG